MMVYVGLLGIAHQFVHNYGATVTISQYHHHSFQRFDL